MDVRHIALYKIIEWIFSTKQYFENDLYDNKIIENTNPDCGVLRLFQTIDAKESTIWQKVDFTPIALYKLIECIFSTNGHMGNFLNVQENDWKHLPWLWSTPIMSNNTCKGVYNLANIIVLVDVTPIVDNCSI